MVARKWQRARVKPILRGHTTHAVNYCGLDAVVIFFK
jgi:hypothetical protein